MANNGRQNVGWLKALNDTFMVDLPETASAVIDVVGDFDGTIEVTGSSLLSSQVTSETPFGRRLVFKSGVGSSGTNTIKNDGSDLEREYRIVTGGQSIRLKMTEWVSGQAFVRVVGTANPSVVFVNGAVHTAEEEAVRSGRAYLASIPTTNVSGTEEYALTLTNPADSGKNLFLNERLFSTNQDMNSAPLEYRAFANATIDLANTGVIGNRYAGGVASSMVFKYELADEGVLTMGGVELSGEAIPVGGITRERKLLVALPPGSSIGFLIGGEGSAQQSPRIFVTLQWYEEVVN